MYIPLFIDVAGWRVLVFGGGKVGLRRAKMFLDAGAEVVVAAKDFHSKLEEIASRNTRLRLVKLVLPRDKQLLEELVKWSHLVVIASSSMEANQLVEEVASKMGKLINNATEASRGNVIVPFQKEVLDGALVVAVTSFGRAGIAARKALEKIIEFLEKDIELRTLYESMKRIKEYMKRNVVDPRERFRLYFIIEDDARFQEYVKKGLAEEAYHRGLEIIHSLAKSLRNHPS